MRDKTFIQDAFRYLVSHVGTCEAVYNESRGYWTVAINGRAFTQTEPNHPVLYVFKCQTAHGLVEVSFKRQGVK